MQELFLDGWVEVGHCVTDVFIFVKKKKKKKKNLTAVYFAALVWLSHNTLTPQLGRECNV